MAKDFSTLKDNVANEIKDTTQQMKEIIGNYINNRYRKVLKACNWEVYNDDYTITTVSGTAAYAMPSDFRKELSVADTSNNRDLAYISMYDLTKTYQSSLNENGEPLRYSVFTDDSGNIKMRFHPVPNSVRTINVPYLVGVTDLSADSDTPINDFGDIIEVGAIADAWRYKRQFAKARDFEMLFEERLETLIWEMENRMNGQQDFSVSWQDYDRSQTV